MNKIWALVNANILISDHSFDIGAILTSDVNNRGNWVVVFGNFLYYLYNFSVSLKVLKNKSLLELNFVNCGHKMSCFGPRKHWDIFNMAWYFAFI